MKLKEVKRSYATAVVEIDERDLPHLERGLDLLLDRYPNSDPVIDLIFDLRKIREEVAS